MKPQLYFIGEMTTTALQKIKVLFVNFLLDILE